MQKRIIVSILNWNSAAVTLQCIRSLVALESDVAYQAEIVVTDNGSRPDDYQVLCAALADLPVTLKRNETNLGFAGGHNGMMQAAIDGNADFVWLVNSDAEVTPASLNRMLALMDSDSACGAVSPVIVVPGSDKIDFCGARHDWQKLGSVFSESVEQTRNMEKAHPTDMWLMGAAVMFRVSAIRQTGVLDDRLFAYFEDDDICARLSKNGWTSRMALDATVFHPHSNSRLSERPAYYFYLMARNSFRFWFAHTPAPYRSLIRIKLIDRSILVANRLHSQSCPEKSDACLLGVFDGQRGATGIWQLKRKVPVIMRLLRMLLWLNHSKHLETPL